MEGMIQNSRRSYPIVYEINQKWIWNKPKMKNEKWKMKNENRYTMEGMIQNSGRSYPIVSHAPLAPGDAT